MRRNLAIILFITFFEILSLSVFYGTTIPLMLAKQSVFPMAVLAHEKSFIFGMILLILPVGQFLITPIWGQLSDQFGRRKILFYTLAGSAIGYAIMGFGILLHLMALFILGRLLTACVAASMVLGQASLADVSIPKRRANRFNLQFIFVSLGFVVGPYVVSFTTHAVHYSHAYWVIVAGYVIAFLLVLFGFKETLKIGKIAELNWMLSAQRVAAIFRSGKLKKLLIIWMIFQLGWSLFFQYSGEFLYLQHHVTNQFINHLFSWVGLGIFFVQIVLVQPLSYKVAPQKIIAWAMLLIGASLLAMGLLPLNISFYVFLGIYCLGVGFFLTNMSATVSNAAGKAEQGRAMAMLASSQSLMTIIVTLAGSFAVSYYLPTPYVVGGAIILVSLVVWVLKK